METIVPELLVREDLIFEIMARGKVPAGDVNALRKQMREVNELPIADTWDTDWDSKKELSVCQRKWDDWECSLEEYKLELPSGQERKRVTARLAHLWRRLKLLTSAPDLEVSDRVWITESANVVQATLDSLKGPSGSVPTSPAPQFFLGPPNLSKAVSSKVSVPEVPTESNNQVKSVPLSSGVLYNKLPNPMGALLQSIPTVDGLEVEALLSFLCSIFKLRDFPGVTDQDLLRMLVPYCRSPLADRLTSVLLSGENFDCFHSLVLECFVPMRLRDKLKLEHFYRPQGTRESLAAFVSSIKVSNRVLRLGLSESEVVDVIVDGINASERSRLVFTGRPQSYQDLDKICIVSTNVQFSDQQREMAEKQHPAGRGALFMVGRGSEGAFRGRGPPVCFGCGQTGHIRRFCPREAQTGAKNVEGGGLPPKPVSQPPK